MATSPRVRRLSLSTAFDDVSLVRTDQPAVATNTNVTSVKFELKCKVRY